MSIIIYLIALAYAFLAFILPALLYYITFYIDKLGLFWGLVVGVLFSEALLPLHFVIVALSGGDIFDALWATWGKIVIGVLIMYIANFLLILKEDH